ncbi:hypothetical protein OHA19_25485 [Streptomyces sp. NBC_00012]
MPPLDPADNSRVSNDTFNRSRPSLRGHLRHVSTALIGRPLPLPLLAEDFSDLLLNGRQFLCFSWEATHPKPTDPKTCLTDFGPLLDNLIETVIPVPADRRIVSLPVTSSYDTYGVGRYSASPQTRIPAVLPSLILYLPTSISVPAASTCINDLIPLIEIVFIALIQHDRIGGSFPVSIKAPRDSRLTLLVQLGILDGLPRIKVCARKKPIYMSEESSVRSHANILPAIRSFSITLATPLRQVT